MTTLYVLGSDIFGNYVMCSSYDTYNISKLNVLEIHLAISTIPRAMLS